MRPLTDQEYKLLKRIADQGQFAMESMTSHDRKTTLQLEGGEQYRTEVKAICADLKYLGKHIDAVQKSVAQLNESLRELAKLRKEIAVENHGRDSA